MFRWHPVAEIEEAVDHHFCEVVHDKRKPYFHFKFDAVNNKDEDRRYNEAIKFILEVMKKVKAPCKLKHLAISRV